CSLAIADFIGVGAASGRLGYFVGSQAARADPDAPDAAIDHRSNGLKVGFESSRTDFVRVADLPSHNAGLPTDFTRFGHDHPILRARQPTAAPFLTSGKR